MNFRLLLLLSLGSVCASTTCETKDALFAIYDNLHYYEKANVINMMKSGMNPPVELSFNHRMDHNISVTFTNISAIEDNLFVSRMIDVICAFDHHFEIRYLIPSIEGEGNVSYSEGNVVYYSPFKLHLPVLFYIEIAMVKGIRSTRVMFENLRDHLKIFEVIGQQRSANVTMLRDATINQIHRIIYEKMRDQSIQHKIDLTTMADYCFQKKIEDSCLEFQVPNGIIVRVLHINSDWWTNQLKYDTPGAATGYSIKFYNVEIQENLVMLENVTSLTISGHLDSLNELQIIIGSEESRENAESVIKYGIKFYMKKHIPKSSKGTPTISTAGKRNNYFSELEEIMIVVILILLCVGYAQYSLNHLKSLQEPQYHRSENMPFEYVHIRRSRYGW